MSEYSKQQLKAELRREIWRGISQGPEWRTMNHKQRKALAKRLFWEIWRSVEDKRGLAQGMEWARVSIKQLRDAFREPY